MFAEDERKNPLPLIPATKLNSILKAEFAKKGNVKIKNLLNARYIDHLSRFKELGIPNPGISFNIGLKIHLEKSIGKAPLKMDNLLCCYFKT